MAKANKKYWQDRFLAVENMINQRSRSAVQAITPAFDRAEAQITKEINAWYQRFADNNQISLVEAKKILNNKELEELKWDVDEYIKYAKAHGLDQAWITKLENASSRFHISRLEALKIRTQQASEKAFGNEVDQLDKLLGKTYTEDYYHTAYEIQKGIGIGWDIGKIDEDRLQKIMQKPWTTDKNTFSDRIWASKTQLLDAVDKELTQMCILGKSPDQAISNISNRLNVSKSQAGRLVMTESAYFASKAQKDCFTDLDVEQYEIVATLDHKTSAICQQMDGQVFKMSDFEAGVTAPPFHPWCRSTTVPYFEDFNEGSTRAARGADGKTYQVPADMKYEDWKKGFVDGKPPENLVQVDPVDLKPIKKQEPLTDQEKDAVEYYVSGDGMYINQDLRNKNDLDPESVDYQKNLDSAISKYTVENDTLYRSVDASAVFGNMSDMDYEHLRSKLIYNDWDAPKSDIPALEKKFGNINGKEIHELGYMSTTESIEVAEEFGDFTGSSKPIVLKFNNAKGLNGFPVKDFFEVEGSEQYEVLLQRNLKYKVNKVYAQDGTIFVDCDFIKEAESIADDVVEEVQESIEELKKAVEMKSDMFPSAFTAKKAELNNTEALCDYINNNCPDADPKVVELYSKMGKMESIESNGVKFSVKHNQNHAVSYRYKFNGDLVEADISIPKLSGDNFAGQVNTTLHEEMHLMDMYNRTDPAKAERWFSSSNQRLQDIFADIVDEDHVVVGSDVQELFKSYKKEYDRIHDELYKVYRESLTPISDQFHNRSITFKEYKKLMNAAEKTYRDNLDYQARNALGGGIGNLQDIYDAMSGGQFRNKGKYSIMYGHGSSYYSSMNKRIEETLANYGSLSVTRPDLIKLLKADNPDLVDALDDLVDEMLKKVGE